MGVSTVPWSGWQTGPTGVTFLWIAKEGRLERKHAGAMVGGRRSVDEKQGNKGSGCERKAGDVDARSDGSEAKSRKQRESTLVSTLRLNNSSSNQRSAVKIRAVYTIPPEVMR